MAKPNIVHNFSIKEQTKVANCLNLNCKFNKKNECDCQFKEIIIDRNGNCRLFEKKNNGNNN